MAQKLDDLSLLILSWPRFVRSKKRKGSSKSRCGAGRLECLILMSLLMLIKRNLRTRIVICLKPSNSINISKDLQSTKKKVKQELHYN